jgi:ubiquinone/menaquinone biosynthesis C-methylase UbiE
VALQVAPGDVIGLDRAAAQLETARRLATEQGIYNIAFVQGEAHKLQWPDHTFDAVYCRFVLEHVADPQAVIAEMRRVVRPGGWVCAYEWEPGCFVSYPDSAAIEQVWQHIYRLQQTLGGDPWVGRKLYGLFVQAGLQAVAAEGRTWSITAQTREPLQQYVTGAKEIIRQSTQPLVAQGLLTQATLNQVEEAYQQLLDSPIAFVMHGFCRAVGTKAG